MGSMLAGPEFDYQLQHMPLSSITGHFGEAGLMRRFELEVDAFSFDGRDLCMRAVADNAVLFDSDTHRSSTYMTHLLRAPIRLIRDYGVRDPELATAAVWHDGPEDHPRDMIHLLGVLPPEGLSSTDAALWALAQSYNSRVSWLVGTVTKSERPDGLSDREKLEFYWQDVADKIADNFETFLLKLSDFTDNAVGILWSETAEQMIKFAGKYYPLFDVFLAQLEVYRMQGLISDMHAETAKQQLMVGSARCRMILDNRESLQQVLNL